MTMTTLVEVGKIVRPHGVRGEVKVRVSAELIDLARMLQDVSLSGEDAPRKVLRGRVHQGAWLLTLERVASRNDAEMLRGRRVSISNSALPRASKDGIFPRDVVGLEVRALNGGVLGRLTELLATGSNDVYVIAQPNGRELLLPALESVVRQIDREAGVMIVVVPDGL